MGYKGQPITVLGKRSRSQRNAETLENFFSPAPICSLDDTGRAIKFIKRCRNKDVYIRDPSTRRVEVYTMDRGQPLLHAIYAHATKLGVASSGLRFTYQGQEISDDLAWSTRCEMVNGYVDCHVKSA